MSPGISVLCVDDDPDVRSLTATALERTSDELDVATASGSREALDRLANGDDPDCIVSDYDMPELNGLELLEAVRKEDSDLPFILFTGKGSEEIASEAISAGVTDYLQKGSGLDRYAVLANRIENAVDRRRTARARRESERELERYRTLVESMSDPMYVLDETGRCTVANEAFCELVDADHERILGTHISAFISRASLERGVKTVRRLHESGRESDRFEVTVEGDDGERWIGEANVTVLTDERGERTGSTAVIRDITERKQRIRELGQYEAIVETAPIGLFAVDGDGYLRWHNEEFTNDLGIERDIVGTHFQELVDDGFVPEQILDNYLDRVRHLLSSANDDEHIAYEMEWNNAKGERGVTEFNIGLLPLEDGEFTGTVHAFRNVTERVEYREELERQNQRLEQFVSIVSHDLRNPLNVAQGHLDLLETECDHDSIEETRWAIDRMEELIDDLLALARYGRTVADRERIELAELANAAWACVDTAEANLVISLEGTITGHEGRVRELLENLFRNAIEHGGEDVTVTVGRITDDGDGAGFFVADNGSGLPETGDIFEFGHTTAADGTGFGLGIVAEIADAHGWQISASESVDGGARFEIRKATTLEGERSAE